MNEAQKTAVSALWDALSDILEDPDTAVDADLRTAGIAAVHVANSSGLDQMLPENPFQAAPFSHHPSPGYRWGVQELIGQDGSIVDGHSVWFATRALARAYARRQFAMYTLCYATFKK